MAKVFVNSISKSGTHLAMQCLSLFDGMGKGIICPGPTPYFSPSHTREHLQAVLAQMPLNGFFCGHIGYRKWLSEQLEDAGVKTLLMIRDPRDVLAATLLWIKSFPEHSLHYAFESLPNDNVRLRLLTEGGRYEGVHNISIPALAALYDSMKEWINKESTLAIRYEELVGPPGGGSRSQQQRQMLYIARFFKLEYSLSSLRNSASKLQLASRSYDRDPDNLARGRIGTWEKIVSPAIYNTLRTSIDPILHQWDYKPT